MKISLNDYVIIYPSLSGWKRIEQYYKEAGWAFKKDENYFIGTMEQNKTENNGYRIQLNELIERFGPYLRSGFLESIAIEI